MIPTKRFLYLSVFLTLALLTACEPLAPEQSPQVIVVTGETPLAAASTPTRPIWGPASPAPEESPAGGVIPAAGDPLATEESAPVEDAAPSPTSPPTITPTPDPFGCGETTGRVIEASFISEVTGGAVPYLMYQPPCFYETAQRYPYVILLHGTGYDETMWQQLDVQAVMDQGIDKGTLPPMALIMPDGGSVAELNDQPDGQSYETVIVDELIPAVEQDFCLWGSREGRAIGGISRGGFWAFSIALRHADLFSVLGGHSPHFDEENALPDSNPLDLAASANLDKRPVRIYLDHSAEDYVATNAQRMSELLTGQGIDHQYVVNATGEHDMDYWRTHVTEYLTFYGQAWPLEVGALPSCLEPSPTTRPAS
ncbi:MAG: esterase family protein [Chloroflexi bacterium]|nr:esterase family protein [Chloroflexota bacterium]